MFIFYGKEGLYMLMTVLHGELAARQSKALIRTFKKMNGFSYAELLQRMQVGV